MGRGAPDLADGIDLPIHASARITHLLRDPAAADRAFSEVALRGDPLPVTSRSTRTVLLPAGFGLDVPALLVTHGPDIFANAFTFAQMEKVCFCVATSCNHAELAAALRADGVDPARPDLSGWTRASLELPGLRAEYACSADTIATLIQAHDAQGHYSLIVGLRTPDPHLTSPTTSVRLATYSACDICRAQCWHTAVATRTALTSGDWLAAIGQSAETTYARKGDMATARFNADASSLGIEITLTRNSPTRGSARMLVRVVTPTPRLVPDVERVTQAANFLADMDMNGRTLTACARCRLDLDACPHARFANAKLWPLFFPSLLPRLFSRRKGTS